MLTSRPRNAATVGSRRVLRALSEERVLYEEYLLLSLLSYYPTILLSLVAVSEARHL